MLIQRLVVQLAVQRKIAACDPGLHLLEYVYSYADELRCREYGASLRSKVSD